MKGAYRTRQQDELLEYLKETPGMHHTAAQIRDHFAGREQSIGTATIYRRLERFVADGTVRKYLLDAGGERLLRVCGPEGKLRPAFSLQMRTVRKADPSELR